jgi:carboxypeptidase T
MNIIKIYSLLIIFLSSFLYFGLSAADPDSEKDNPDKYSLVKINISEPSDIMRLQNNDITVEHYHGNIKEGIVLVLNQKELNRLKFAGMSFEIKIPDMNEYYLNRQTPSIFEMQKSISILQNDNIAGFGFGSMGGYYTYDEIIRKLDSMRIQYPNIITAKFSIGPTVENRQIYAVKISDNPDVNESATEAPIYFDALHHAREPQSMACMMYYIYWLLENYGTNPEATYLLNNREIFFVPVMNVDGYVYNQTTNPNGGGNWRKNRRNNGAGNFGIDLNRNYDYGWGENSGSSNDPSSETYRGPSAASEPETQAVKLFLAQINPKISFTMHSAAGRYLNPYGYNDSAIKYEVYSEFSSDFAASNNYLYGTVKEMLDYYSSGTTRDYLHSNGTYCWTPEVGGTGFWPSQSEIIPVASENLFAMKYLSWVGGAFADFRNYKIEGNGFAGRNDTLDLLITLKNRGLSKTSKNVTIDVTTNYANAAPVNTHSDYDSIYSGQSENNLSQLIKFGITSSAVVMDEMKFFVSVKQEGIVTSLDTIRINVGKPNILYSENAENGTSHWSRSGTGILADTTFVDPYDGNKNFSDSRYGNARDNSNSFFNLLDTINLVGSANPRIEFAMKWAMETTFDYFRIQISTNFGSTWTNMPGRYTRTVSGQPSYTSIQHWKNEQINLNAYIGQKVKIRFSFITDSGVPGDGYYFDNFKVINYTDTLVSVNSIAGIVPDEFRLYQNYPNPFNPSTVIRYSIKENAFVKLKVYDVLGNEVATLVNQNQLRGSYNYQFSTVNYQLPSGIYYYKLESGDFSEVKKMILLK